MSLLHFRPTRAAQPAAPTAEVFCVRGSLRANAFRILTVPFRAGQEVLVRVRVTGLALLYVYDPDGECLGESADEVGLCLRFTAEQAGSYFILVVNDGRRGMDYVLSAA